MRGKTKTFLKDNWFKILATILLLWALTDNPYGYYQFLRWAVLIIAAYSAYIAYNSKKMSWAWTFGITAVLFNPIIPFYFSKETWQIIDVFVAIIFSISIFNKQTKI
jgi:hypothetical protein